MLLYYEDRNYGSERSDQTDRLSSVLLKVQVHIHGGDVGKPGGLQAGV